MTGVRRAQPADAALVGRLLHDFNTEFGSPTPDAATFARRFEVLLGREDVVVLIAGATSEDGFAYLTVRPTPYYDGTLAQLEELYVAPHLRDRGIGTVLLSQAVEEVRRLRAGEININVDEVDTDTRRFYERHGFTTVEPGASHRMLCYVREL